MKRVVSLFVSFILSGAALPSRSAGFSDQPVLAGFSADSSRVQRQWEEKFKAIPNPQLMRDYMQHLSARPHNVGATYDKENAEWLLAKFKEFGLDAHIETFDILFPTPKERAVELVEGGPKFTAKLQEPAVAQDPTSNQQNEQLPTYNAYSMDGDVTAPLVFVNYGIPEDYDQLARLGVSVKGAIVIAKYGHSWRGIKPKVAAEHGAFGCLIYSDPNEDGFMQGETFPAGAWRPRDGVQRGSVADDPIYPGDPLTPGVGATKDAKRLDRKDVPVITKIPVLPISYGDAEPLLAALTGPIAPRAWRGGLGMTYRIGPGPAKVHLRVKSNWDLKTIYDVIGKIPGTTNADQWVIRGNHHDAWVNGAEDPISGLISVMEEARAMGELVKQGWKPKRTIIFCAWDAEEPGLIGSTEFAEQHAEELKQHAVVYINSDVNARGFFGAEGSHTLEKFINDVARDVQDPETKLSVWKRAQLRQIGRSDDISERQEARSRTDLRIGALGSGSDYGAFLQHDGVAALNLGFGGEDGGGIYHSIYDDFYWYTHFSDGEFVYGRALAQTAGTAIMRLADADLLPFEFTNFADTMQTYVKELKTLAQKSRDEIIERNRELDEGVFAATADPRVKSVPPPREAVPPFLNFAPLDNAADAVSRAASEYRKALDRAVANGGVALASASLTEINQALMESEHQLTLEQGLPGRPWFKHFVDAPGQYTGYQAKTLPAVREPIRNSGRMWTGKSPSPRASSKRKPRTSIRWRKNSRPSPASKPRNNFTRNEAAIPFYNLALVGFGNVGRALLRLLVSKETELRRRYDVRWRLTGVATRRAGWLADPDGVNPLALLNGHWPQRTPAVAQSVVEWLDQARADVFFETSSLDPQSGQPATDHLRAALRHGAHAISANKGPVVHAYNELVSLARERGKQFLCESTVMDGVPIFSLFPMGLPATELRGFSGVLNSTTNIVLTEIEKGSSFEDAIRRAQALGIAETDPSNDLDGWDSAVKVVALTTVLMGLPVKLDQVQRTGVRDLSTEKIRSVRAAGMRYKLVCRAERRGAGVECTVRPELLLASDPLANLEGTSSAIRFDLDFFNFSIVEHNPGIEATAYGLLADFLRAVL